MLVAVLVLVLILLLLLLLMWMCHDVFQVVSHGGRAMRGSRDQGKSACRGYG